MKLSSADFTALRIALRDAFPSQPEMETLARAARNESLDLLALGPSLDDVISRVISRAEDGLWVDDLIEAAWQLRQTHTELTRIRNEWRGRVVAGPVDPLKTLVLPGKTVLLDRKPLRDALTTLQDANGSRVLIIDGEPESGKTYSVHYISYLARARKFNYSYVNLELVPRNANNKIDASSLGDFIAGEMIRQTYRKPIDNNLLTWINSYAGWLEEQIPKDSVRWLIIDNFGKVTLEENAFDLIAELAMRTYRNLDSVRLLLLSYQDRELLQSRVVGMVEYERITAIGRTDLVRFFGQVHLDESARRQETFDSQVLKDRVVASVTRVLGRVPDTATRRLESLCRTVWEEVEMIRRPTTPAVDPVDALTNDVLRDLGGGGAGDE